MVAPHAHSDLSDIAAAKQAMRERALLARAGCDPAWGADLARVVTEQAPPRAGAVVAGFLSLTGEIDLMPLLLALAARGHELVLPVTPKRGLPLTFRAWRPGEAVETGRFNTRHPVGPERTPDFLLVPLLAFDARGNRLGYGAGYYDRTIAGLPGVGLLGCAFAAQMMDAVPTGPSDIKLPAVATERGVIFCKD